MTLLRRQRDAQPRYAAGLTKSDIYCRKKGRNIQNRKMYLVGVKRFATFADHIPMKISSGQFHGTADGRRNGNPSNAVRDMYGTIPLISQRSASQLGKFSLACAAPLLPSNV